MRSTAGSAQPRIARVLLVCVAGCSVTSAHLLPLKHFGAEQVAPSPAALEIVTASTTVPEPLQVRGAPVAFVELAPALREAVATQVDGSFQQWRLSLELTQADAEWSSGRLIVRMTVRATLRARADNAYVAQSQHVCSTASVVPPENGAKVAHACLLDLARDTASWLQRIKSNQG
ncbi:MAG: hypothetical protein QM723_37925 [Myxococcaceae bacterium]